MTTLPPASVFLVYGESKEVDPIENAQRIIVGSFLVFQFGPDPVGATLHLQPSRKNPLRAASPFHAFLHRLPDPVESTAGFRFGAKGAFIGERDFGNTELLGSTEGQQIPGTGKRERQGEGVGFVGRFPVRLVSDESSAQGIDNIFL